MPEMQREEILAQRQEEMQTLADKINLSKLLASQAGLGGGGMADDSVAQAAKRELPKLTRCLHGLWEC
jgi:RNA polymerase-associated protein RTF1